MRYKTKILIAVIIILIVIVNIFTAVTLIKYFNDKSESQDIFTKPSKIILHNGEKTFTVTPDDIDFKKITELNKKGATYIEWYTLVGSIDPSTIDDIWVEYLYDDEHKFVLELDLERREITTNRVGFILTNKYNGYISIYTSDEIVTVGALDVQSELIKLVKDICK